MSFDGFIKIDGIDGESTDDKYPGWIEAIYFDTGLRQKISPTVSSAGGASVGRADFDDFFFSKQFDKASPKLALACAEGAHVDNVIIDLCRAGSAKMKYMTYKLSNCIISNVTTKVNGDFPIELVKINFGKIEWSYIKQNRSGGGAAGQIATGWDLQRNCKL